MSEQAFYKKFVAGDPIGLVAAYSSIISLLLSVFGIAFEKEFDTKLFLFLFKDILLICALISALVYVIRRAYKRELEANERVSKYSKVSEYLHSVCHLCRDYMAPEILGESSKTRSEKEFYREFCNNLASTFSAIAGKQCQSSIKLIDDKDTVITIARDSSSIFREDKGKHFSIQNNTAFHTIYNDSKRQSFLSNNLTALEKAYQNETENWWKYYNATIVVPIRWLHSHNEKPILYGFLCVDSLNPVFNSSEHIQIMGTYADSLFNYINYKAGPLRVKILSQRS